MLVIQAGATAAHTHWPLSMLADQCMLEKAECAAEQAKISLPRISSMTIPSSSSSSSSASSSVSSSLSSSSFSSSIKHKRKLVPTNSHSHSRKQLPAPPMTVTSVSERPSSMHSAMNVNSMVCSPPQSFVSIASPSLSTAPALPIFAAPMRPIQEHSNTHVHGASHPHITTRRSLTQRRYTNQLLPSIALAMSQDNSVSEAPAPSTHVQTVTSALFNPVTTPSPIPASSPTAVTTSSVAPPSPLQLGQASSTQPQYPGVSQSTRLHDRHSQRPFNLAIDTHAMERRSADQMSLSTPSTEVNPASFSLTSAIEPSTVHPTPFSDFSNSASAAATPSRFSASPSAASASTSSASNSNGLTNSNSITSLSAFFRSMSKKQKPVSPKSHGMTIADAAKNKSVRRNTFSFFNAGNQSNSNSGTSASNCTSPTPTQNPPQTQNASLQELQMQMARMVNSTTPLPSTSCTENSSEIEISLEYKQGEVIGRGPHGKVYVCMAAESGEMFAIKVLKLNLDEETREIEDYMAERAWTVSVISSMRHKHFVNLFGFERIVSHNTNSIHYQLIMEHVAGRSVSKMLLKFGAFDERVIRSYSRQLLLAVRMLHQRGYVHGNIKSSSLLINRDGKLKLLELESVMTPQKARNYTHESGVGKSKKKKTPLWTAPEVFQQNADFCSDVWSIACTIIEMAQVMPPWLSATEGDIRQKFTCYTTAVECITCSNATPAIPSRLSDLAKDFLSRCLQRDVRSRASINDLCHHPWLKDNRDSLNASPMLFEDFEQPHVTPSVPRRSLTFNPTHSHTSPPTTTHSLLSNVNTDAPANNSAPPGSVGGVGALIADDASCHGVRNHNRLVAKDLLLSIPMSRHSFPHAHLSAAPLSGSIEEVQPHPSESEMDSDEDDEDEDGRRKKCMSLTSTNSSIQTAASRSQRGSIVRRGRLSVSSQRHGSVSDKVPALRNDRSRSHSQSEATMQ